MLKNINAVKGHSIVAKCCISPGSLRGGNISINYYLNSFDKIELKYILAQEYKWIQYIFAKSSSNWNELGDVYILSPLNVGFYLNRFIVYVSTSLDFAIPI